MLLLGVVIDRVRPIWGRVVAVLQSLDLDTSAYCFALEAVAGIG
jgi:hypothetical protein